MLDALLEADRFKWDALSGTSAGALNAIVMAHGLAEGGNEGGNDGARAALAAFWDEVGAQLPEWFSMGDANEPSLAPAARVALQWSQLFSPYQLNPAGPQPAARVAGAAHRLRAPAPGQPGAALHCRHPGAYRAAAAVP